jgi:hypothetical protein
VPNVVAVGEDEGLRGRRGGEGVRIMEDYGGLWGITEDYELWII